MKVQKPNLTSASATVNLADAGNPDAPGKADAPTDWPKAAALVRVTTFIFPNWCEACGHCPRTHPNRQARIEQIARHVAATTA